MADEQSKPATEFQEGNQEEVHDTRAETQAKEERTAAAQVSTASEAQHAYGLSASLDTAEDDFIGDSNSNSEEGEEDSNEEPEFLAQVPNTGTLVIRVPAHPTLLDADIENETEQMKDEAEMVNGQIAGVM
ncbi:hypothetical protein PMZ80_005776 [Knufia obscura]|uniref:Uncharacterized protein n=2 Tax=Knufia TaxID=430999 RepID=A0AAN8INR8_9EURO|nr:hypothetical protein PMZ80_005776 [Knufia obscura]KAK5954442.1 hypothetical protein OHC33_004164 [Knufia fluminis]